MDISTTTLASLSSFFTPVAEKIGQGAQYGWQIVIQQQYVTACLGIFWALLGIAGMILCAKYVFPWAKKYAPDSEGFTYFIAVLTSCMPLLSFIIGATVAITHFLNPAFYALQFFINLVK